MVYFLSAVVVYFYSALDTLSGDGTKTYKWDAENRLVEIDYVGTSNKSVFSYDGMGHRTVDAETTGGTTTTTRYLWCGSNICQTRDGSDNAFKRDLAEGEYNIGASQKLVYMPDQLGSVRDVIDATSGNLMQSYDYTPYGGVARSTGSVSSDYQYAGLFKHAASGLNMATHRTQDENSGRWINRDPIRERGGINLYAYVRANPLKFTDRSGLQFIFPVPTGGGTYMQPPWPTPPLGLVPPPGFPSGALPPENGPGKVYGIGICEFGCVGFSVNDAGGFYFNPGAGLGGPSISEEYASNMKAYCSGKTTKGGFGGTVGGNKDSTAVGWQFPFGGVQTTYGIPIRSSHPVSNPLGPIWYPR